MMALMSRQWNTGRRIARGALMACASALLSGPFLTCDYFTGLVTSDDVSRSTFSFLVVDTGGSAVTPVRTAWVEVDETRLAADSAGRVTFGGITTGVHAVRAGAANFLTLSAKVEVTLDRGVDTLRLGRVSLAPAIDTFYAYPARLRACEDTAYAVVAVRRTVWPISRVGIYPAAPDTHGARHLEPPNLAAGKVFRDTVPISYSALGAACGDTFQLRAVAMDESGNMSEALIGSVYVSTNRRPRMSVESPQVFYDSIEGRITVRACDPDGDLDTIAVDWGDHSQTSWATDTGTRDSAVVDFAHIYWLAPGDAVDTNVIAIRVVDSDGAQAVLLDTTRVVRLSRLIVAPQLTYAPHQVLNVRNTSEPIDSSVTIRVKVISTPGHIESILWSVYSCDADAGGEPEWHYEGLGPESGGIPPWGREFSFTYNLTSNTAATCDSVSVVITNSYGRSEKRYGVFYIF